MADLQALYDAILTGNLQQAVSTTEAAIAEKVSPQELLDKYMIPAMDEVGARFERNEFFVPELLIAARAMRGALDLLKPLLKSEGVKAAGVVAIGTVKGDLHDIGKNLVASMLEGAGFEIVDLGVDVKPEDFVKAIQEKNVNIVALSALLTTTMPNMKTTIDAINEAGLRDKVKIIIGGAPVTRQYAEEIGADGYGDNANAAVTEARRLLVA
ncbi:MAG: cobalamin-binding protein [Lentisphaerae bacterium]|nr:MAG: cobalamin-binding protein [Lentisphaerota bacterium]